MRIVFYRFRAVRDTAQQWDDKSRLMANKKGGPCKYNALEAQHLNKIVRLFIFPRVEGLG
jgi:hypothetical protein